jgi:DNA invertase Pin-like site-specific DNA recombinase
MTNLPEERQAAALREAIEAGQQSSKSMPKAKHDREVLKQKVIDAYMAGVNPVRLVDEVPGVTRATIYSWLPEGAAAKRKGEKG